MYDTISDTFSTLVAHYHYFWSFISVCVYRRQPAERTLYTAQGDLFFNDPAIICESFYNRFLQFQNVTVIPYFNFQIAPPSLPNTDSTKKQCRYAQQYNIGFSRTLDRRSRRRIRVVIYKWTNQNV